MLLEYVENVANRIISGKEEKGEAPASASYFEIQSAINEDLLECMRQLHNQGKFKGYRQGVNNVPALIRRSNG